MNVEESSQRRRLQQEAKAHKAERRVYVLSPLSEESRAAFRRKPYHLLRKDEK